eukprot:1851103-Ditylum_brightwellii.AAC.1
MAMMCSKFVNCCLGDKVYQYTQTEENGNNVTELTVSCCLGDEVYQGTQTEENGNDVTEL